MIYIEDMNQYGKKVKLIQFPISILEKIPQDLLKMIIIIIIMKIHQDLLIIMIVIMMRMIL